jgi:hypothetical protein
LSAEDGINIHADCCTERAGLCEHFLKLKNEFVAGEERRPPRPLNAIPVPRDMVARKPPHGAPCNGCGVCCYGSLCKLAQAAFDRPEFPGPCPALIFEPGGQRALYGVVLCADGSAELASSARLLIGAGQPKGARINFRDALQTMVDIF